MAKKTVSVENLKKGVVESLIKKLKGKGYTVVQEKLNLVITTKDGKKNIQADIDEVVKKIVAEVK
jgi:uncharacterized protein YlzI (FlbEa/FlbD family)